MIERYLRGDEPDQLFARIDVNGSTESPYWYLTDRQGSIRNLVDNSGNIVLTVAYDAYGNITSQTGTGTLGRYAWTGRELDAETGLQYNRARYYDQTTGRWATQDPMGFDAGDSNVYRYVNNDPAANVDPAGLAEIRIPLQPFVMEGEEITYGQIQKLNAALANVNLASFFSRKNNVLVNMLQNAQLRARATDCSR